MTKLTSTHINLRPMRGEHRILDMENVCLRGCMRKPPRRCVILLQSRACSPKSLRHISYVTTDGVQLNVLRVK